MTSDVKKITVLASGSGTNLQALIDAIRFGKLHNVEISAVISNKKESYALERARLAGIEALYINPDDFQDKIDFDKKLCEIIKNYEVDLIVLAGYTKILSDYFIDLFPGKIINIHPSLLPKFGGKGMYGKKVHEAVLANSEKESGCTVHIVTNDVDLGPIIGQRKVPVFENDSVDTLSKRVLMEEHNLLIDSVKRILFDKISISKELLS